MYSVAGQYYLHTPSRHPRHLRQWNQGYVQCVSIDPAIVNLGVRIERRYFLTADNQRCLSWQPGQPFRIEVLLYQRFNMTGINLSKERKRVVKTQLTDRLLLAFIDLLDFYKTMLFETHFFIIEQQLATKNPMAMRVFQHILSYLFITLRDSTMCPDIYEVNAGWVKSMMGLLPGLGKRAKTIMPYRVQIILLQNGDFASRDYLFSQEKKDDLADIVAGIEVILRFVVYCCFIHDLGTSIKWETACAGNHVLALWQQQYKATINYARQGT